jgi:hypothetical protein
MNEKVAAPVYKTEINGRGNSLHSPHNNLYPQKLALTSPTSGDRSVGILRSRNMATEFSFFFKVTLKQVFFEYFCFPCQS